MTRRGGEPDRAGAGGAATTTSGGPRGSEPAPTDPDGTLARPASWDGGPDPSPTLGTLDGGLGDLPAEVAGIAEGLHLERGPPLVGLPPHLRDLGVLAEGGMGKVCLVADARLGRVVALKTALDPARGAEAMLREARLTARLDHPNIVPVYDCGQLPDGQVWFTMRVVRGRSLGVAIADLHAGTLDGTWGTGRGGWTLRRLVAAFEQVCNAALYAHREGVVHRDLKPGNVLIGGFGEVVVVDWGLGQVGAAHGGRRAMGTPGYMPPEQADGSEALHGPHSDVFALGAVLFTMLTGSAPWGPEPRSVLRAPRAPWPVALEAPEELRALCERALAWLPAERGTVTDLLHGVRSWLDGARRREEATALLDRVRGLPAQARRERAAAEAAREEGARRLEGVRPWAPEEEKAPAWALEDHADELEASARLKETEYVEGLNAVLQLDPGFAAAERLLAEHYRDRLLTAEALRDPGGVARAAFLLERHDRAGAFARWLSPEGAVTLVTDPPGARVVVERYERVHRRLIPTAVAELGPTPLHEVPLPVGSYRLRLEAAGRPGVYYPVVVRRGAHWDGVPPEGGDPVPIRLPERLDPGECYVPAGWFMAHGDPEAIDPLPGRRMWADGFRMDRFPVTFGAWAEFLDALEAAGEEVDEHVPIGTSGGEASPFLLRGVRGWTLAALGSAPTLAAEQPVVGITHPSALRFAAWRRSTTGLPWRLPHDLEWEKAGRGVDGRCFPWGDHFDPAWACVSQSLPQVQWAMSVSAFPVDVSPYGVRGLAGNSRDWCANGYLRGGEPNARLSHVPPGELAHVRGGTWLRSTLYARLASRTVNPVRSPLDVLGVRLCAGLDP